MVPAVLTSVEEADVFAVVELEMFKLEDIENIEEATFVGPEDVELPDLELELELLLEDLELEDVTIAMNVKGQDQGDVTVLVTLGTTINGGKLKVQFAGLRCIVATVIGRVYVSRINVSQL